MKQRRKIKIEPPSKFPSGSRLNWLGVYLLLLAYLISPPLSNGSNTAMEITCQQFDRNIMSHKAAVELVVVNNEKVQVYLPYALIKGIQPINTAVADLKNQHVPVLI